MFLLFADNASAWPHLFCLLCLLVYTADGSAIAWRMSLSCCLLPVPVPDSTCCAFCACMRTQLMAAPKLTPAQNVVSFWYPRCLTKPCLLPPHAHVQLMAAPKLTPAERRWRKKMAAAGGQPPDGEQPPQQEQQGAGRAAGGRPALGRRQQQQQQPIGGRQGGRAGGRQQFGQQPFGGRGAGRFGSPMMPQQGGSAAAGGRQEGQRQAQQPVGGAFQP